MKLKVIGSSSGGNCYVLQPQTGKALILEAGMKVKDVGKAITYRWADVAGVLLTHEHLDHAANVKELQNHGLTIFSTPGTAEALHNGNIKPFPSQQFYLGDFIIRWFDTNHDAKQPCGFLISHPEMGCLVFATDTAEIKYKFPGVNHMLIEANYDPANTAFNTLSKSYIERVRLSHLSINQAEEFVEKNQNAELDTIVLLHLSSRHANKTDFRERILKLCNRLGIAPQVEIAAPWLVVDLQNYKQPTF